MREGNELVGWGMATGIWEAMQMTASARAVLTANGSVEIASATADIGPGTYTMMTQIAAEMLGVPLENVTAKLGDSDAAGGAGRGRLVHDRHRSAPQFTRPAGPCRRSCLRLAQKVPAIAAHRREARRCAFAEERSGRDDEGREISSPTRCAPARSTGIEKEASAEPDEASKYAHFAHSAIFAEVKVDEQLGVIRVTRVVSAVAAGRILNPKLAGSQILGAVVGGIGMALHEETAADHRFGRFMTHNLADYHVPMNADMHEIDVIFVEEKDEEINPLGVKGVGEIGIIGTAAAIANAVYHATGKRVRDLPITLDKLMRD